MQDGTCRDGGRETGVGVGTEEEEVARGNPPPESGSDGVVPSGFRWDIGRDVREGNFVEIRTEDSWVPSSYVYIHGVLYCAAYRDDRGTRSSKSEKCPEELKKSNRGQRGQEEVRRNLSANYEFGTE